MKLFQNWQNIPQTVKGAVYAIGNFDGMHLGHQTLLKQTLAIAKKEGKLAGVITFEPISRVYFAKAGVHNIQLMTGVNKIEYIKELGFDLCFQLPFDQYLAHYSGKNFIEKVLIDAIGLSHLVVGFDFVYGYQRSGDVDLLKSYADRFACTVVDKQLLGDQKIGSTAIREAIEAGNIALAKEMLGHDWVVDLQIKDRQLFFRCYVRPPVGEYVVRVLVKGKYISDILVVNKKNAVLKSVKFLDRKGFIRVIF